MAIAHVQTATLQTTTAGTTLTSTFSAAGANSLLVAVFNTTSSGDTISSPAGWTAGPVAPITGASHTSYVFWKQAAGGETSVTVSWTTSGRGQLGVVEYSGIPNAAVDVHTETDGGATNITTLAATTTGATTVANTLALAWFAMNAGDGGFVSLTNSYTTTDGYAGSQDIILGTKILSSTSVGETTTATWTTARKPTAQLIVFKSGVVNATVTPAAVAVAITVPHATVSAVNPNLIQTWGRTIGGDNFWGTATWGSASTWSVTKPLSDLATRLLDSPAPTDGTSVGPKASGGLRFVVQVLNPTTGIDSVWGTSQWGESKWSSSVGNWQDLTSRVRGLSWTNGINDVLDKAQVGQAALTLANLDGALSRFATSGPYTHGGKTWVRSGVLVRFGVMCTASVAHGLPQLDTFTAFYTGKIYDLNESTSENTDAQVDLTLVETTNELAPTPDPQTLHDGGALSAAMLQQLLDSGWGYQTSLQVPADDDATVGVNVLTTGTTVERLSVLADCAHWDAYADGRGRLIVVRRHNVNFDSGLTFSNDPEDDELPLDTAQPYSNYERIANQLSASRIAGPLVVAEDTRSMQQFGTITNAYGFPRTDLPLQTDDELGALLNRVLSLRAWDDRGLGQLTLNADMDSVRMPAVMTYIAGFARQGITFTVRWVHPSGKQLEEVVVIEAQNHSITPQGNQLLWTATLTTGHAGIVTED